VSDVDDMTGPTRRGLVRGAAAGSLLLLAGARGASAQLGEDRTVVTAALDLERRALAAYEDASTSEALDVDTRGIARRFAEHQREHVDALAGLLGQTGGADAEPAGGEEEGGGGRDDFLRTAIGLEEEALRAYRTAHERLRDASLVKLGSGVMANHGQHLVVLRDALEEEPLTDAFAGLR
jgi:rubrerythrin